MPSTHQRDGVSNADNGPTALRGDVNCGSLETSIVTLNPSLAIIRLRGELDCATAELLTAVLANQRANGRRYLRLDLSALEFLDCAGLNAIVRAHHHALASRGTLVLTGLPQHVCRLLRIAGLDNVLCIADGLADLPHLRDLVASGPPTSQAP